MARYVWEAAKNDWLLRHRGISFEQVVWHITEGHLLDVLISDRERYRGQRQLVVEINGYAYLVPLMEQGDAIILKTIIPSRKLTKQYLRKGASDHDKTES